MRWHLWVLLGTVVALAASAVTGEELPSGHTSPAGLLDGAAQPATTPDRWDDDASQPAARRLLQSGTDGDGGGLPCDAFVDTDRPDGVPNVGWANRLHCRSRCALMIQLISCNSFNVQSGSRSRIWLPLACASQRWRCWSGTMP